MGGYKAKHTALVKNSSNSFFSKPFSSLCLSVAFFPLMLS